MCTAQTEHKKYIILDGHLYKDNGPIDLTWEARRKQNLYNLLVQSGVNKDRLLEEFDQDIYQLVNAIISEK